MTRALKKALANKPVPSHGTIQKKVRKSPAKKVSTFEENYFKKVKAKLTPPEPATITPFIEAVEPSARVVAESVVTPTQTANVRDYTTPTEQQYISLQEAYDYFNRELFTDTLPPVLITLQQGKKYHGYYWHEKFSNRQNESLISELALNIAGFSARDDKAIYSTLVHEMVHHWQHCFGEPSRNSYHNKNWADKMKEVGLYPSSTGQEGGKETGQKVSHYIIAGGMFEHVCDKLLAQGVKLHWESVVTPEKEKAKKKANKVKYTCPECGANAWGKPELHIHCGDCNIQMISEA